MLLFCLSQSHIAIEFFNPRLHLFAKHQTILPLQKEKNTPNKVYFFNLVNKTKKNA